MHVPIAGRTNENDNRRSESERRNETLTRVYVVKPISTEVPRTSMCTWLSMRTKGLRNSRSAGDEQLFSNHIRALGRSSAPQPSSTTHQHLTTY